MEFSQYFVQLLKNCGLDLDSCSDHQIMTGLIIALRNHQAVLPHATGERKLYYFSAEFLIGRLLRANLINLGLLDEVESLLRSHGRSLAQVEDCEPEPSLGNGGLGRLAACFLDSIASLGLSGDGVGLNYHYGLFRQDLSSGAQRERPDPWLQPESWLIDTGRSYSVPFRDGALTAKMYDLEIPGYDNGVCNRLHLFDVASPGPAPEDGIDFDKTDIAHYLTAFLYPDDSDEAGRLLRVYQQYFLVSAGAQLILEELIARGHSLQELDRYVVIHINDTHPSMVIPEMIRLLTERGVDLERAIYLVERTCAYTNHTILAEALEKWPAAFLDRVAPQLLPIIRALDDRARRRSPDPATAIWDDRDLIHMAHMDIHYSSSVNGVAALHTEILKSTELSPFYALYPQKFNNKTNGITFRRWLMGCNPALADLITGYIGPDWKRDPDQLEGLLPLCRDEDFLRRLLAVKRDNKARLAAWLEREHGITVNPESVFDIQIKRLHQYKRQQMNALYAVWKYLQIKSGALPSRPVTMIFGAKAAPAYTLAKDTIHLILCLSRLVEQDPQVAPWLKIVMVENYNVSAAEALIPACDISEQISLASKEASGTGNMKFMANGAVTLGTMDGANVEIAQLVGQENLYLFGRSSDEVIRLYRENLYRSSDYWQRPGVGPLVDFILSPQLLSIGSAERLTRLYKDFIAKDYFMALLDLEDYIAVKECCLHDYENRTDWARKTLVNIARSGFFSSDRTIREYNHDIWYL
ncbi:Maltodextrin phosphorylase [uncultured Flavonifractor sp.]|nr:Maltodextrin phosphorylase [uncultured Flavonifractor sp.]